MSEQPSLYTFFESSLNADPGKAAIIDQGVAVSYRDVAQRVKAWQASLCGLGIKSGDLVGVHMKPGSELVAALLAITKLGAVFVPLETSYPTKRLHYMVHDAGLSCLIAERFDPDFDQGLPCPKLYATDLQTSSIDAPQETFEPSSKDVCYVIYTSGTTGDPKGVLVSYGGAMNTIVQSANTMDIQASDRLLQLCPISFDVFILEIGMVLQAGATSVFTNDVEKKKLDVVLREANIQHILCTPAFVADIDLHDTPLKCVMFGGEPLPHSLVAKYLDCFRIVHAYGVTEASICSTLGICDRTNPVAMGEPVANTELELLDTELKPVATGEPGEIVVSGLGVSNGYLNRTDLTARHFVDDPKRPGAKRYRTGDMAKRNKDGKLLFLGRRDRQIKYREHRLEMSEVEAILMRHQEVSQAAVFLKDDQLWAFVCLKSPIYSTENISEFLLQYMSASLVPEVRRIGVMPLTSHGKIDYAALQRMLATSGSEVNQEVHLRKILGSWESRAQVRQNTLMPESLFDKHKRDFLPEWLPFHNHPVYQRQRHLEDKILSIAWLIYNQVTINIENDIVIPLCLAIQPELQNRETLNTVMIQAMTDESYHVLLTAHASEVTRRVRHLEDIVVPKSGFVRDMQRFQAGCSEDWQRHLVGMTTAVVTEVFIGSYLALIAHCKDESLQPFNVMVTKAHWLDESVHGYVFAALAEALVPDMPKHKQQFFTDILPEVVYWYFNNRVTGWSEILPSIGFEDSAEMLAECRPDPAAMFDEEHFGKMESLANQLGCHDFRDRLVTLAGDAMGTGMVGLDELRFVSP